ncbi:MAG TPA: FAD-dependent oxidoreductase [Phototrophicaceae bacterium]|nr:FAD-dependent oxidoreductase [Phototrophicaceae bacterium]
MNIIVIGAGYAGMIAALRLAGKARHQNIILVNPSDTFVDRIRLHQWVAGEALPTRSIPKLLRGTGIQFVQARVTAMDPNRRELTLQSGSETRSLSYDQLVYALGSSVDTSLVPGIKEYALTLNQAAEIKAKLQANPRARVLICGGGLSGIELSSEIAEAYPQLSLTLVTRDPLGVNLSQRGHAYMLDALKRRHITVREGVTVERITADGVETTDGQRRAADLVIWAGSFAPSPLARESGIAVNRVGQIIVDPYLRSVSHPDVFAVGDAAACGLRMACATAMPEGAHAADNLAALIKGQPLQPFRFGFAGRCISLGRHEGMLQWVNADDSPKESIVTGRLGAFLKELISRYPTFSLNWEYRMPGLYYWPKPAEVAALKQPSAQRA